MFLDGLLFRTGDEQINITPGSSGAETAEVYTVTNATALTAGSFSFTCNGKALPKTYAYTATGTTIATDINTYCLAESIGWDGTPIICTGSSGHMDSGTSGFTLTFTNLPKKGFGARGLGPQLSSSATSSVVSVAYTTPGVPATGAAAFSNTQVQIDFLVPFYRHCHINQGVVKIYTSEPYDGTGTK